MWKKGFFVCLLIMFFSLPELAKPYIVSAEETELNRGAFNWEWPVQGIITDHFGSRGGSHFGIDIAAERGTNIYTVDQGRVHKSYYSSTYGHVIFIKHPGKVETVYAHLSERLVEEGEVVERGQVIGKVGNTGRSDGNHLHFEVHTEEWNIEKSNAVDPLVLLDEENHRFHALEVSQTNAPEDKVITIQSGDTLWSLSKQYSVSVENLMLWNDLGSDLIVAGNPLIVFKEKS
ncbi:peptidoglycan DD-metalloendopeptidase family protein [Pseudalkalibacillus sp. Hm43]|uniref:peptidoglycan DD-metalloendopeptidase family protein n=1 Tax=Pseudalkalibacillus sp. Hm43 TaxID=3450742 RepID=UPI003F42A172